MVIWMSPRISLDVLTKVKLSRLPRIENRFVQPIAHSVHRLISLPRMKRGPSLGHVEILSSVWLCSVRSGTQPSNLC
jgi:hypothetical protein